MTSDEKTEGMGGPGWSGALAFRGLVLLLACFALYFGPRVVRGEVLLPHTGAPEAGVGADSLEGLSWWYLDVAALYVPETAVHLDPNRVGWLATWTPHNGLGRPLFHVGFGPAFLLARAVALFTSDPFVHYSWMASLSVILSGLFAYGYLMARRLHPAACLGAALALSIGPLYPTWPMIPLVQWGFAWAFGALFATEIWCQRRSYFSLVAVAFAVHGILLTGFLEHTLGLGWMVGGWVLLRVLGATESGPVSPEGSGPTDRGRLLGGIVLAAGLGVLSVLPVYIDLFVELSASTRLSATYGFDPVFEGRVWPSIFAVLAGGAPGLDAFSIGATVFSLMILGTVRGGAPGGGIGAWYWFAWVLFMAAATGHAGVHGWLRFLGLGMSGWPPVLTIFLPVTYLLALGLHDVLTRGSRKDRRRQLLIVVATLAAGVVGHLIAGPAYGLPIARAMVMAAAVPALVLCLFLLLPVQRTGVIGWLVVLALILPGGMYHAQRLVAWKDRAAVHTESELSRLLQERTRDGSRYVWVANRPLRARWMPPNVDALLKTRGLQTYDHLPSREFHALVEPFRPERERIPYVRRFTRLAQPEDLNDARLALAGLGTVLSGEPLDPSLATPVRRIGEVLVSEPVRRISPRFSVPLASCVEESEGDWRLPLESVEGSAGLLRVLGEKTDALRLAVPARPGPQLVFLSQQYHRHWRASGSLSELKTVRVNGLYQGVILPVGETEFSLEFRPWSPWIVLSQLMFLLAGLAWTLRPLVGMRALGGQVPGALLAAIFASGLMGCAPEREAPAAPHRPDVYLLMADTFRADNLGLQIRGLPLCPELDELARDSRVFRHARTPATWTLPAHASLFTGRYPREIGVTDARSRVRPELETLAEAFAAAGYRTAAVTDAGYVSSHFGMDQGFESFVTTGNMTAPDFDLTVAAVEEALERPADDRPLFLFVQSYRAHSWTVSEATRERLGAGLAFQPDEVFTSKPWRSRFLELLRVAEHGEPMVGEEFDAVVGSMVPSYRGAAADTSEGFGRVLEVLRAQPRFPEAAIVFTSDHGEAFGLHGVVSHGNGVWEEQGRIPLLISAPWIASGADDRPASLIDLPRTLASLAGIEPVSAWRGTDLLSPVGPQRPLFVFQTLPAKTCYVAMIEDGIKWIFIDQGGAPGDLAFVYDLKRDELEEENLSAQIGGGDREAEVRGALGRVMGPMPTGVPGTEAAGEMDPELDRQLRGMGYGGR
ncbi:Choline-sulfatase [Planctomycetes bacterium Poly30]|uniref:Choline-sulfatase n=1 Tax=Saltatorellus ferox TaxID=2528018 RepID=A0A518EZY2_9BACT|nr:Choline-sulfatase [Planctomycetes bacterium Poly30]